MFFQLRRGCLVPDLIYLIQMVHVESAEIAELFRADDQVELVKFLGGNAVHADA